MPLYLAYLGMGAISPDKTGLKLSERDQGEYRIARARKLQETRANV